MGCYAAKMIISLLFLPKKNIFFYKFINNEYNDIKLLVLIVLDYYKIWCYYVRLMYYYVISNCLITILYPYGVSNCKLKLNHHTFLVCFEVWNES